MPAPLAILICIIGVLVLFHLNRDKSVRTSKALWLAVLWIVLIGSRPVTSWFETGSNVIPASSSDVEGNPVDAAVFAALLSLGIIVLASRGKRTRSYLAVIVPLVLYSTYCLISVIWSPVPVPSLKRWVKDLGDIVMVLVILTDDQPLAAMRQIFSRVGFILFPLSVVLIRYTSLGRAWDNQGVLSIVGVTTNKNMFGAILFVISVGVLWNVRWLLMNPTEPGRGKRLAAQGVLLGIGLMLLTMAHSSTSIACFLLGSGLILATHFRVIRRRPSRVPMLGLAVFAFGGFITFFAGTTDVASLLGRDASFSGRTVIWTALIPTVSNPLLGTGFDSYWDSPNVEEFQRTLKSQGWYHPEGLNEAHDGYLEVYLDLGWIGLCLIGTILGVGYWSACKGFKRDRELGGLLLAYIVTGVIYNVTEAGFRTLSASWFFILLAFVGACGLSAGLFAEVKSKPRESRWGNAGLVPIGSEPARQAVWVAAKPASWGRRELADRQERS